jgi:hypothetical protein
MNKEEVEHSLKLKCIDVATTELLATKGFIKATELMKRARQLYMEAKVQGFESWNIPDVKQAPPVQVKQEILAKEEDTIKSGFKVCPGCGESVPQGFKKHKFKQDGSQCGVIF